MAARPASDGGTRNTSSSSDRPSAMATPRLRISPCNMTSTRGARPFLVAPHQDRGRRAPGIAAPPPGSKACARCCSGRPRSGSKYRGGDAYRACRSLPRPHFKSTPRFGGGEGGMPGGHRLPGEHREASTRIWGHFGPGTEKYTASSSFVVPCQPLARTGGHSYRFQPGKLFPTRAF